MTYFELMHKNTTDLHYEGKNYDGANIIIDAAEIAPGKFEIMAMFPGGKEIEYYTVFTLEEARAEYAAMLEYHTTGVSLGMYTHDEWHRDRTFSPEPGQEVSPAVYWEMLEVLPPLMLPRSLKERFHCSEGFMVDEPVDFDPETKKLRYSTFYRKNGHHFYAGKFSR